MGAFVARHGMTSAQYQAEFSSLIAQGNRLVEGNRYGVGSQTLSAAIWDKAAGPAWEAHHGDDQARLSELVGRDVIDSFVASLIWPGDDLF
jgi:hypothetical protein